MKYLPEMNSIRTHTIPQWYNDCKFGIFIHWGIYSVPAWAILLGSWEPSPSMSAGSPTTLTRNGTAILFAPVSVRLMSTMLKLMARISTMNPLPICGKRKNGSQGNGLIYSKNPEPNTSFPPPNTMTAFACGIQSIRITIPISGGRKEIS